jgi:hypothetical protein
MTWVLLITVLTSPGVHRGAITALGTISGYATKQECMAAGQTVLAELRQSAQIRTYCVPGPSSR